MASEVYELIVKARRGASKGKALASISLGILLFCGSVIGALLTYGLAEGFGYANWTRVYGVITACIFFAGLAIWMMIRGHYRMRQTKSVNIQSGQSKNAGERKL